MKRLILVCDFCDTPSTAKYQVEGRDVVIWDLCQPCAQRLAAVATVRRRFQTGRPGHRGYLVELE